MILIAYIFVGALIVCCLFLIAGIIIENNLDESNPVMKWWRKHIVGLDPEDSDYLKKYKSQDAENQ